MMQVEDRIRALLGGVFPVGHSGSRNLGFPEFGSLGVVGGVGFKRRAEDVSGKEDDILEFRSWSIYPDPPK